VQADDLLVVEGLGAVAATAAHVLLGHAVGVGVLVGRGRGFPLVRRLLGSCLGLGLGVLFFVACGLPARGAGGEGGAAPLATDLLAQQIAGRLELLVALRAGDANRARHTPDRSENRCLVPVAARPYCVTYAGDRARRKGPAELQDAAAPSRRIRNEPS